MEVASIPDLPLSECLKIVAKQFDVETIASREIDQAAVLEYYRQSDRGYRLFHSREGAMHVALDRAGEFTTAGYLGQVELIAERVRNRQAENVLEVGCGVGYNLRHLAALFPEVPFTGVDLSAEHVTKASQEAGGLQNANFEQGDFHHLRFAENSFDAVYAVECLCQGENWREVIADCSRVLRPGGQMIVVDCFRHAPLANFAEDLQQAARLVEKTMAVEEFAVLDMWLEHAQAQGLTLIDQKELSDQISQNLARFYSLSRRDFKLPLAARAFLKAFPPRLIENAISGLLMPFTVGSGLHRYYLLCLEKH